MTVEVVGDSPMTVEIGMGTVVVDSSVVNHGVKHLSTGADPIPYPAAGVALVEALTVADQRAALGLGDSATKNVGTTAGTVAAGDDARIPTTNEKTRLSDIQAATGATTALKLANLTSPASTTQQGVSLLAEDGGTTAGTVVQGNDSRLAKAPTTWTPVPSFGDVTDDGTRTTVLASVVYIGKMAFCEFIITWTAKGTKTGEFKIRGFPANPASGVNTLPIGSLYCTNMSGLTTGVARSMVFDNDSIRFRTWSATGLDSVSFTDSVFTNTTSIRGRFSYQIA